MQTLIFDVETTSVEKDSDIIELAIKIIGEDGAVVLNKSKRYKPTVPIAKAAFEAHGISEEMLEDEITFAEDAKKLKKLFENKILCGYNIMVFDVPVLLNQFDRCGVEVELSGQFIDVMKLETLLQPRTLSAVYERYVGKPMENAHAADADVTATETIFQYQLKSIAKKGLNKDETLASVGLPANAADYFGKLKYNDDGELIFNFGKKCMGKKVKDEVAYANWILSENFPSQVKKLIRDELKKNVQADFKNKPHVIPF